MTLSEIVADAVLELKRIPSLVTEQIGAWNVQIQEKLDALTSVEKTFYKKEGNGFSPVWLGSYDNENPANLDEISDTNIYEVLYANTPTNNWGFVQHFEHRHSNGYSVQIFHSFYHDTTWKRRQDESGWTEWVEV